MPLPKLITLLAVVLIAAAFTIGVAALASPALGTGAALTGLALLITAAALRQWPR